MWWLFNNPAANGIFNLGTGKARTWNDLIKAVFAAMGIKTNIEYIEMPESLRNQYQYFTEAQMSKLKKAAGCPVVFSPLEDSVRDYVVNYLQKTDPHLSAS
jgi:ADP-L-glycero-D-manno-heptose 6-epimerase